MSMWAAVCGMYAVMCAVYAVMCAGGPERHRMLRCHVLLQLCLTQPQARELIGDALARTDIAQGTAMHWQAWRLNSPWW